MSSPSNIPHRADQKRSPHDRLISLRVEAVTYSDVLRRVLRRAQRREPGFACFANVHMVMEAYDQPELAETINRAFVIAPDGQPLRWALRLAGKRLADRCYGPFWSDRACRLAERLGLRIGLYGGHPEALAALQAKLLQRHPGLQIVYHYSPPFRPLNESERNTIIANITNSKADMLFVGLGCPKQERWMAAESHRLPLPLLGVGAWFDFASGRVSQAPTWMQNNGLEWLHRLCQEPRRLWRRYAWHNPRYIALIGLAWLRRALR